MMVRHDWITLHANGIRYLEKAPLMYWGMALSFRAFGPKDWAARLPLALFALALFLVTYAAGRSLFGSAAAGFYGALILLTSFGIFIYTRIMIPDVIVCLWLSLAMLLFWRSLEEERPSRSTAWGFALACALGVLTKGLIGVVFPLAIVVLFLLLTRDLGHLRRWHPVSSLLVFLAAAVPWHIAAGVRNPAQGHLVGSMPSAGNVHGFFWFYFINEQYLRYLNERVPRDYDTVPLALFWGLLVVFLMPWIAYILHALGKVPWRRMIARAALSKSDQARALLVLWAAFVLVFFSFSTRQEYYSLPALPPLALLIGAWLAEEESSPADSRARIAAGRVALGLAILGVAGALVAGWIALRATPPSPGTDLSTLLSQNPGDYALSLGHFLDLSTRAMSAFRMPLLITAGALLGGTARQPAPLPPRPRQAGERGAGRDDGALSARHAHGVGNVLSGALLEGPRRRHSSAVEPGQHCRNQRRIRGGLHPRLLSAPPGTHSQRALVESLVRLFLRGCATHLRR